MISSVPDADLWEIPDAARRRRPGRDELRRSLRAVLLVFGVGLQHEFAYAFLRLRVGDRPKQCEAATVTIDDVLAGREGDVATATAATLPDSETDQLHAVEFAVVEMQLGIREFAGRVAFVVRSDLDDHDVTS